MFLWSLTLYPLHAPDKKKNEKTQQTISVFNSPPNAMTIYHDITLYRNKTLYTWHTVLT